MNADPTRADLFTFRPIVCPTCNVDDTRVRGQRGGSAHRDAAGVLCNIVQCRRCGLIYANPFPFPKDLDALYSQTDDFFVNHDAADTKTVTREALIAEIERYTDGRRLLDVGTGLGETVAAALNRGWDAYGIESSEKFASEAARRCGSRIFHGIVEDAPPEICSRPYDAVLLVATLEHLHEPQKVLSAISRLLRPGGVLFTDVPNELGLYFRIGNSWLRARGKNWVCNLSPTFSPYHVYGFSKRSLTSMLRTHGLEPEAWHFHPGNSPAPLRPSLTGVLEWAASRTVLTLSRFGELGTYIECISRKQ